MSWASVATHTSLGKRSASDNISPKTGHTRHHRGIRVTALVKDMLQLVEEVWDAGHDDERASGGAQTQRLTERAAKHRFSLQAKAGGVSTSRQRCWLGLSGAMASMGTTACVESRPRTCSTCTCEEKWARENGRLGRGIR